LVSEISVSNEAFLCLEDPIRLIVKHVKTIRQQGVHRIWMIPLFKTGESCRMSQNSVKSRLVDWRTCYHRGALEQTERSRLGFASFPGSFRLWWPLSNKFHTPEKLDDSKVRLPLHLQSITHEKGHCFNPRWIANAIQNDPVKHQVSVNNSLESTLVKICRSNKTQWEGKVDKVIDY